MKILGVSETDSACYVCEVCVTYVQCTPPDTADNSNVRCFRDVEQCLDASSALLCSESASLGAHPPRNNISVAVTSSSPGIPSNGGGGTTSAEGGVAQTALYGGIAVCLVLAVTSVLLTIVIIVLCANKSGGKNRTQNIVTARREHGDSTRAVVGTGYRNPAGDTLFINTNSDGTFSSSGASSNSSGTILTAPSLLTLSPNAHAGESNFNIGAGCPHRLPPNQFSGESNCALAGIPVDHSAHPRSPRLSSNDSNPQSLQRDAGAPCLDNPSSVVRPTIDAIHHYHVLELRPVSEVGSDTATQTREDSWGTIGLSALHQGRRERPQQIVQSRDCECVESALPPETGLLPVEAPPQSAAAECCRYTKLDVSTLGSKHDYAKRSIQADPDDESAN
ncbi:hypothetical protein EMCRGX_G018612 [Ephydatia muelleri]